MNELLLCQGHWRTFKVFFWPVSLVRPTLLPNFACRFQHLPIPCEGTESDRDLSGSGSPSTYLLQELHVHVIIIRCC